MIKEILQENSSTVAKVASGKLTNFEVDGLLFDLKCSGASLTLAHFDGMIVNATLRSSKGKDLNIMSGVRMSDLLKLSDFCGGLSQVTQGVGNPVRHAAYVSLGNIILEGDDSLDVTVNLPLHATVVIDLQLSACDLVKMNENIKGYETLIGNGSEILVKDCNAIYHCSAETGYQINVSDQERSYVISDRQAIASGISIGQLEKYDDFGIVYTDGTGLSQDVRVKIESGKYELATKSYFPVERMVQKANSQVTRLKAVSDRIASSNPEKARYLAWLGLM